MKCRECSKVIPDGFSDCPWCGAASVVSTRAAVLAPNVSIPIPTQSAPSTGHAPLAWTISFACLVGVVWVSYLATARNFGTVTPSNIGVVIGRCVGAYLLSGLVVFAFYFIREKKVHFSTKMFFISDGALLLALVSLLVAGPVSPQLPHEVLDRLRANIPPAKMPKDPYEEQAAAHVPTKWDTAVHSLANDIRAFNEQYVSEVSKSETASLPIYTPESFRDAPTIQEILEQLHARKAVADHFTTLQPVFDKMPEYVESIDATASEKEEFLRDFHASARKCVSVQKIVSALEEDWLTASIGLYEFALSKQGEYTLRDGDLTFKSKIVSIDFNRKLQNAERLRAEFSQASYASHRQEAAGLVQYGVRPSDLYHTAYSSR